MLVQKWGHISADSYSTCQALCCIWSCNYGISVILVRLRRPFTDNIHMQILSSSYLCFFMFVFLELGIKQRFFVVILYGVLSAGQDLFKGRSGYHCREQASERAREANVARRECTKSYFHQFKEVEINMTVAYLFQWLYFWVISRQMTRWGLV